MREMKVTSKTFNTLAQIRREEAKKKQKTAVLQRKLKSGKWGKPIAYEILSCESTAEDVIARLEEYNPSDVWRVAE